jgi:uncharacterized membrane protein YbhN (UPF0104 family)
VTDHQARRTLRVLLSLAAGAALLWLAFRGVDPGGVAASLAGVRLELLAAAIAVDLCVFLVKALKWRLLLAPLRRLPVPTLYSGVAVGALVANVVPFRLDELARAAFVARRSGLPGSAVLGTILVERAIDVSILLCAVGILLVGVPGEAWLGRAGVALAVGLAAFWLARLELGRHVARAPARAPGALRDRARALLERALGGLGHGLGAAPSGRRLAGAFGLGIAEWGCALVHLTLVLRAFGSVVPPDRALLLGAASYLGFALPTGPAGLGGFELLVRGALETGLALEPARALGIALAIHALLVLPISVIGAAVLVREGGWRASFAAGPDDEGSASLTPRVERA